MIVIKTLDSRRAALGRVKKVRMRVRTMKEDEGQEGLG